MKNKNSIKKIYKIIHNTFKSGNKVFIAGNGGSAEISNHIAGEFVATFMSRNRKSFPMISLCSNVSIITAIGNDFGFNYIFERQLDALGVENDLVILMSTSGNSKNLRYAIKKAKIKKIKSIGLFGKNKTDITKSCDFSFYMNSRDTARIQEDHLYILHETCRLFEK